MTRKHFIAIAEILNGHDIHLALVLQLGTYFHTVNRNFDFDKFQKACLKDK